MQLPAVVLTVFMITNLLNFAMVAGFEWASGGAPSLWSSFRSLYVTVLPVEVAMALLTASASRSVYGRVGVGAVGLARRRAVRLPVPALQRGIQAYERGEELPEPDA